MSKAPTHICKFKRLKYKTGNTIFFCTLPDCNKKISIALALGKKCICWRCDTPFIMNEYSLRLAKPHCDDCHKPKKIDISFDEIHSTGLEIPEGKQVLGLSLAERLSQTIKQTQQESEDEI